VTSCFEVFIKTNLMIQSEFNLGFFWFRSYNIFFIVHQVGAALDTPLSLLLSHAGEWAAASQARVTV
jgi:hypothetical protein